MEKKYVIYDINQDCSDVISAESEQKAAENYLNQYYENPARTEKATIFVCCIDDMSEVSLAAVPRNVWNACNIESNKKLQ